MTDPDYTPRYLLHDKDKLGNRVEEDRALLAKFGVAAIGFSPGVLVQLGSGSSSTTFQLNDASWNWLRPLLVELEHARKSL